MTKDDDDDDGAFMASRDYNRIFEHMFPCTEVCILPHYYHMTFRQSWILDSPIFWWYRCQFPFHWCQPTGSQYWIYIYPSNSLKCLFNRKIWNYSYRLNAFTVSISISISIEISKKGFANKQTGMLLPWSPKLAQA